MDVQLDRKTEEKIRTHGEMTYPFECCGFLYGKEGSNREIYKSIPAINSRKENQKRRFSISAEEYFEAEKYAMKNDLDLLGIYHSHPDHPADPSEHDRKQAMPFFSYFIVSVKEGKSKELKSWTLNESFQFDQEEIKPLFSNLESEVNE